MSAKAKSPVWIRRSHSWEVRCYTEEVAEFFVTATLLVPSEFDLHTTVEEGTFVVKVRWAEGIDHKTVHHAIRYAEEQLCGEGKMRPPDGYFVPVGVAGAGEAHKTVGWSLFERYAREYFKRRPGFVELRVPLPPELEDAICFAETTGHPKGRSYLSLTHQLVELQSCIRSRESYRAFADMIHVEVQTEAWEIRFSADFNRLYSAVPATAKKVVPVARRRMTDVEIGKVMKAVNKFVASGGPHDPHDGSAFAACDALEIQRCLEAGDARVLITLWDASYEAWKRAQPVEMRVQMQHRKEAASLRYKEQKKLSRAKEKGPGRKDKK